MDVINAAKKISEAGIQLDKLAKQIADQVLVKSSVSLSLYILLCILCSKVHNLISKIFKESALNWQKEFY